MSFRVRRVDYFYTNVVDRPGEGYELLSALADVGVNLLAFTAVPVGPTRTQLSLFPDDPGKLQNAAKNAGFELDGPHPALLAQGDDRMGALAEIHGKLHQANVNVFASNAVTDGKGNYGYVMYVRPEDIDRAESALEI